MDKTIEYYNQNADMFAQGTRLVDFTIVQERFRKMLPVDSRILDFGCGSGRDTKYFLEFEDLFKNHSYVIDDAELKAYSKNWHKPAVAKDLARYDQTDPDTKVEVLFQPRGAQIEALCALENSRAEGASRGLVHAATGVGKTYLAAFDSAKYERVLFVAHREEILKQAAVSFKNVRHSDD